MKRVLRYFGFLIAASVLSFVVTALLLGILLRGLTLERMSDEHAVLFMSAFMWAVFILTAVHIFMRVGYKETYDKAYSPSAFALCLLISYIVYLLPAIVLYGVNMDTNNTLQGTLLMIIYTCQIPLSYLLTDYFISAAVMMVVNIPILLLAYRAGYRSCVKRYPGLRASRGERTDAV